jgi:pimeloyl-ACP methyl ester carboxylesterase
VLLHGLFSDSQSFVTLGRRLSEMGFRTLAPDLPGHGKTISPAASLPAIVAAVEAAMPEQQPASSATLSEPSWRPTCTGAQRP